MPRNKQPKPVIFVAFANDRADGSKYLRNLPEEKRQLSEALRNAEELCEYVEITNATAKEIFERFQKYRDRIAIFHFGGHANSYQLLLETADGMVDPACSEGLAAFLGQQKALQLVFLNGCSTRLQAKRLLESNVSAVITTSREINDKVAMDFAAWFYRSLASGASIDKAFKEAEAAVQSDIGGNSRNAYLQGQKKKSKEEGWPWKIEYEDGARSVVSQWNLPACVKNPLFSLPPLAKSDLPLKPFRHLSHFTRTESAVFFGRGYEIRELYDHVTVPDRAPIILLYGQSGVGKSSILDAALMPRLESNYSVQYYRRDSDLGLPGTLNKALLSQGHNDPPHLAWLEVEARLKKPLVVILDQVEEAYTRPKRDQENELTDFLSAVRSIFEVPTSRPAGKLILGFRKEWLAELEQNLEKHGLGFYSRVFLQPLDRDGIIEAIDGITQSERLRSHYGLTIEESLVEIIANDLLKDNESPISPTLQILLTKMWDQAKDQNSTQPAFTIKQYQELQRKGILLADFLDQQLAQVKNNNAEHFDSGLALDVLFYHTTGLGTAAQRTRTELQEEYKHCLDALPALIQMFKDLYLLADDTKDTSSKDESGATRLAHDTLAPLIRDRFSRENAPGQRARRILENRVVEWKDGQVGIVLDENDLRAVESGASGMRAWTPQEKVLIEASREQRLRREESERTRRQLDHFVVLNQLRDALDKKDYPRFYERLEQSIPSTLDPSDEVRSFAWYYLWRRYHQEQTTLNGHDRDVSSVSFSPDGLTLASGSWDDTIVLWDVARRCVIAALPGHDDGVSTLSFSPDGKTLASGGADKTIKLWDVAQGDEIATLPGHTHSVTSVSFSPDGKILASGSSDKTIKLWDLSNRHPIATLPGHGEGVSAVSFSPDGKTLASASLDHTCRLWDVAKSCQIGTFSGHADAVNSISFSPTGKTLASASADVTIKLWDVASQRDITTIEDLKYPVYSVSFSPDGATLACASTDNTIRLWDPASEREIATLRGHSDSVSHVSFSPDGKMLASGSVDNSVKLWDVGGLPEMIALEGHEDSVASVCFSPDGKLLASGSKDNTVKLWDVDERREIATLPNHASVSSVSFSPDGKVLASGTGETIQVWDVVGRSKIATFPDRGESVLSVSFSPDGKMLADGAEDSKIKLWDVDGRKEIVTLTDHEDVVMEVSFSPDGKTLASASQDILIKLWDVASKKEIATLDDHTNSIYSVSFSPDGKTLASGSADTTIKLWDVSERREIATLSGHSNSVHAIRFSPDGKTLASGHADGKIRLWDVAGKAAIATLEGPGDTVYSVSFSPDGKILASGGNDKTIRLYFAATNEEIARQRNT